MAYRANVIAKRMDYIAAAFTTVIIMRENIDKMVMVFYVHLQIRLRK